MIKQYYINKNSIIEYRLRNLYAPFRFVIAILVVFFIINSFDENPEWHSLFILTISILGFLVIIGLLSLLINNEKFFTYEIMVTDDKIARKGDGYKDVEINLNDIGKIKKVTNGSLVYTQKASYLFKASKYKKIGIYDDDIIWIPFIMTDYKDLIVLLKSKVRH